MGRLYETPVVNTDAKGHHLRDTDGNTIQTFPKNAAGLKAAKRMMYKKYADLNVSQEEIEQQQAALQQAIPATEDIKDNDMSKLEEMYKQQLDEVVTITNTITNDPNMEDSVKVDAHNDDANELVLMLKRAGVDLTDTPGIDGMDGFDDMDGAGIDNIDMDGGDVYQPYSMQDGIDAVSNLGDFTDIGPELDGIDGIDSLDGADSLDVDNSLDSDDGLVMSEPLDSLELDSDQLLDDIESMYSNEPDESYGSPDLQLNKMSGGLNRQKRQYKGAHAGDNAMALETFKSLDEEEKLTRELFKEYKGYAKGTDSAAEIEDKFVGESGCDDDLTEVDWSRASSNVNKIGSNDRYTPSAEWGMNTGADHIDGHECGEVANELYHLFTKKYSALIPEADPDLIRDEIDKLCKKSNIDGNVSERSLDRMCALVLGNVVAASHDSLSEMKRLAGIQEDDDVVATNDSFFNRLKFPDTKADAEKMQPTKLYVNKMSKRELGDAQKSGYDPAGNKLSDADKSDASRELERRQQRSFTKKPWKASTPFTGR